MDRDDVTSTETELTSALKSEADMFTYELKEDGTVKITGLTDGNVKEINIPKKIAGSAVTEIVMHFMVVKSSSSTTPQALARKII